MPLTLRRPKMDFNRTKSTQEEADMSNSSNAYFPVFSSTSLKEAMSVCDMLLASGIPATLRPWQNLGTGEFYVLMPANWEVRSGLPARSQPGQLPLAV